MIGVLMPWTRDQNDVAPIGYSGSKMTAEDYEREAELIVQNWEKGYIGGTAEEALAWAFISRRRAKELRTLKTP